MDVEAIQQLLATCSPSDWESHDDESVNPNKKGVILRKASHINLKFTNRNSEPFSIHFSPLWETWKSVIQPLLDKIVEVYGYDQGYFPIIMFAKLPPKSPIIPHSDGNMNYYAPHKIHVPITTNDQTFFFVNKQRYAFEVGKVYEVDNISEHAAINGGTSDRIHLIFEYMFGEETGVIA